MPLMERSNSLTFLWNGLQGPTTVVDQCLSRHIENEQQATSNGEEDEELGGKFYDAEVGPNNPGTNVHFSYGALKDKASSTMHTIRFQVVVWSIGTIDVLTGRVPMKFRVTMFWDHEKEPNDDVDDDDDDDDDEINGNGNGNNSTNTKKKRTSVWVMQGRNRAVERVLSQDQRHIMDIPALSILNADSFEVIGAPEVAVLRERRSTKLMRWTCMYRATLIQEEFHVENFPHDQHDLCLKLGVLSQRERGGRWDRTKYRVHLATENDTQGSTRCPEGILVDHVRVPEFSYNTKRGLHFDIEPLSVGMQQSETQCSTNKDERYLVMRLTVIRDSGYYDRNIMPLLCLLNMCAMCLLIMNASYFFQRALCLLNISFLEIGLRTSMDKSLPSVGYQIKMQRILNQFFFALLLLVVESALVYVLNISCGVSLATTSKLDLVSAFLVFLNMLDILNKYYSDMQKEALKLL